MEQVAGELGTGDPQEGLESLLWSGPHGPLLTFTVSEERNELVWVEEVWGRSQVWGETGDPLGVGAVLRRKSFLGCI